MKRRQVAEGREKKQAKRVTVLTKKENGNRNGGIGNGGEEVRRGS